MAHVVSLGIRLWNADRYAACEPVTTDFRTVRKAQTDIRTMPELEAHRSLKSAVGHRSLFFHMAPRWHRCRAGISELVRGSTTKPSKPIEARLRMVLKP